jgi:hypothetical protein
MASKKDVDPEELAAKVVENPGSKKYNNPNSRENLKQYAAPSTTAEVVAADEEASAREDSEARAIVVGRKLSHTLVKSLMPQRGVFTPSEKKRFIGIIEQYLTDFKSEEPTAADVDDIYDIAKSDIMETRLLEASKGSPETLVAVNQSMERLYKRKQTAKSNLSARRVDRKDSKNLQDITIVDLVARYDIKQKQLDKERVEELLNREAAMSDKLLGVLDKDGY